MNFHRFKIQLVASLVLISSVPLVLFAIVIYEKEAELVRQKALSHLESVVAQSSLMVEEFKQERIHDLNLLAATVRGLDREARLSHFRDLQEERKIFRHLFMTDRKGRVLVETTPVKMVKNYLGKERWFTSVLEGKPFLGDIGYGSGTAAQELLAAVPVRSAEGQVTGVLGAAVDFQGMAKAMKSVGIGSTGEIYLLNKDGVFLTTTRVGENRAGERLAPELRANYFTEVGPNEFMDYRGNRVVRVHKKLTDLNWILVGEQDSSEVLRDIASLRAMFAGFVALLIVLVAVTGSLVSAGMVRLLKRAYEQKKELELQVIQKDKLASMGLLTAGIAHELNTPLASALLYTQMLKEDMEDGAEPVKERLRFIEEEIKRGSRIIRNLLDFSRQSRTDSSVTDINEALRELLDISGKLCADRGIDVKRVLDGGIPLVRGNSGILHQVLMNIVANAVEAMEDGGTLSVATRFVEALHKVVVEIGDTGPGIPEEHLKDVFDPFFTTKSSEEGTGLGLAISYSMVRKLGGNIRVTSSCRGRGEDGIPATGTTFTLELPVEEETRENKENMKRLTT